MIKTISLLIGNSDDKLSQKEWSRYVESIEFIVTKHSAKSHFTGFSKPDSTFQNACWVFEIPEEDLDAKSNFIDYLQNVCFMFRQDSITMVVAGTTTFIHWL